MSLNMIIHIKKISILPKITFKLNKILHKYTSKLFSRIRKLILNFIWKNKNKHARIAFLKNEKEELKGKSNCTR